MSGKRLSLSVALITYNEEDRLSRVLESVKDLATEIIVVDSHSTDKTREIAESFGAKVFVEDWKGFVNQKNSALQKCSQEWVLFLDADEVLSEELQQSIKTALKDPQYDGYMVNRRTYYLGKFLRYTWQPEWRLRLVKRNANPRWEGRDPHDVLKIKGRVGKLRGDLYHYSFRSLKDHLIKSLRYAEISSEEKFLQGLEVKPTDLFLRPLWNFTKLYFIKGGIRDGLRGFLACSISSFYTFMKYAFLLEKKLKSRYGSDLWEK